MLCRRLTGKFWAALVGGAVFGFSAYEMNHSAAGQLNLTFSLLVPILAYLIVIWWQGSISTRAFVVLAALAMATQFYLFLETFADMTGILVVALLGLVAGRPGRAAESSLRAGQGTSAWPSSPPSCWRMPYLAFALSPQAAEACVGTPAWTLSAWSCRGRAHPWHRLAGAAWPREPSTVSSASYVGMPLLACSSCWWRSAAGQAGSSGS